MISYSDCSNEHGSSSEIVFCCRYSRVRFFYLRAVPTKSLWHDCTIHMVRSVNISPEE